jgi:hypothetical protein
MKMMTSDVRADDVALHDLADACSRMRLTLAALAADPHACAGEDVALVVSFGDPVRLRLERAGRTLCAPPQSEIGPAAVSGLAAAAVAWTGLALGRLSPVATERLRGLLAAGAALELVAQAEALALRVAAPQAGPVTLIRMEAA